MKMPCPALPLCVCVCVCVCACVRACMRACVCEKTFFWINNNCYFMHNKIPEQEIKKNIVSENHPNNMPGFIITKVHIYHLYIISLDITHVCILVDLVCTIASQLYWMASL